MNKKLIYLIVAVIVVVAVGLWILANRPLSNTPATGTPQAQEGNAVVGSDTTGVINQDLNNITVEDLDFKSIDSDLNSL